MWLCNLVNRCVCDKYSTISFWYPHPGDFTMSPDFTTLPVHNGSTADTHLFGAGADAIFLQRMGQNFAENLHLGFQNYKASSLRGQTGKTYPKENWVVKWCQVGAPKMFKVLCLHCWALRCCRFFAAILQHRNVSNGWWTSTNHAKGSARQNMILPGALKGRGEAEGSEGLQHVQGTRFLAKAPFLVKQIPSQWKETRTNGIPSNSKIAGCISIHVIHVVHQRTCCDMSSALQQPPQWLSQILLSAAAQRGDLGSSVFAAVPGRTWGVGHHQLPWSRLIPPDPPCDVKGLAD